MRYKRRSKNKPKENSSIRTNVKNSSFEKQWQNTWGFIKKNIIPGVLLLAIGGFCGFCLNTTKSIAVLETKLEAVDSSIDKNRDESQANYQKLDSSIGDINSRIIDIGERLATLEGRITPVKNMKADPGFAQSLIIDPSSLAFLDDDSVVLTQPIAYSQEEGRVVLADELIDQRTIYTYNDGKDQVVFCGQYDEEGRWNGNCIINVYDKESRLIRILDGDYLHGQLINYRQVLSDYSKDGDIWLVSDRIVGQSSNHGATWKYKRDDYIALDCDISELSEEQIYDVNTFVHSLDILIIEYYEGDTSNLLYNDNSGKAYLVKYFTDNQDKYRKYVKTLYVGCFSDGQFNDHTGDAWYIVKDTNTEYMYYKGTFTDGNPDVQEVEIPLSLNRINEIIQQSEVEFDCPLDWDI